ncbi:Thaumatin [Phytophthora cactorum]|nr:Thaumatin [Phytophthora cactorum]
MKASKALDIHIVAKHVRQRSLMNFARNSKSALLISPVEREILLEESSSAFTPSPQGSTSISLQMQKKTAIEKIRGNQWIRRDDTGDEATLAEFSISGGYTWYDISVIHREAAVACPMRPAKLGSKSGYNVVMNIAPVSSSGATLTYESEQCSDAYLHPSDNTTDSPLTVTFYPQWIQLHDSDDPYDYDSGCYHRDSGILGDYKPGTVIVVREHYGTIGQHATISSSFVYCGTDAGSATGTYGKVTEMSSCTTEAVSVSDPVETFSEEGEEVSIVFCVPTNIYKNAVLNATLGSD